MRIGELVMDVVVNSGNLNAQLRSISTTITTALSGVITAALAGQIRELAMEATKAEIAVKVFNNTLKAQGQNAVEAQKIVNSLAAEFKVMPEDVMNSATALIRMGATMEQVQTLFRGAGASALAYGRDAKVGFENVSSAVVTGTSALLNQIGIAENLGPTLDKYARSLGKTSDELTAQERLLASTNMILKATEQEYKSLGDMMGGLVGENAELNKALTELRRALGTELTPVVREVTNALAGLIRGVKDSASAVGGFGNVLQGIMNHLKTAVLAFGGFTLAVYATNTAFRTFIGTQITAFLAGLTTTITTSVVPTLGVLRTAISALLGPIGLVTLGLTGLMTYASNVANQIQATYNGIAATIDASTKALMGRVNQLRQQGELGKIQAKILLYQDAANNADDPAMKKRYQDQVESLRALAKATQDTANEEFRRNNITNQGTAVTRDYLAEARKLLAALDAAKPGTQAWIDAQKALDAFTNKNKDAQYALKSVQEAQKLSDQEIKKGQKTLDEWSDAIKRVGLDKWKQSLEGKTDAELKSALAVAQSAKNADQYTAIIDELNRRVGVAQQKTEAWKSTLSDIKFQQYVDGLEKYSDAQLRMAERNARAAQDTQKLNAVLAEQARRAQDLADIQRENEQQAYKSKVQDSIFFMDLPELQGVLRKVEDAILASKDKIERAKLLDKKAIILDRISELEDAARATGQAMGEALQDGLLEKMSKQVAPESWTLSLSELKANLGDVSAQDVPKFKQALTDLASQGAIDAATLEAAFAWLDGIKESADDAEKALSDLVQAQQDFFDTQAQREFADWRKGLEEKPVLDLKGMLQTAKENQQKAFDAGDLGGYRTYSAQILALQDAIVVATEKARKALEDTKKSLQSKPNYSLTDDAKDFALAQYNAELIRDNAGGMNLGQIDQYRQYLDEVAPLLSKTADGSQLLAEAIEELDQRMADLTTDWPSLEAMAGDTPESLTRAGDGLDEAVQKFGQGLQNTLNRVLPSGDIDLLQETRAQLEALGDTDMGRSADGAQMLAEALQALDEAIADGTVDFDLLAQTAEEIPDHFTRIGQATVDLGEQFAQGVSNLVQNGLVGANLEDLEALRTKLDDLKKTEWGQSGAGLQAIEEGYQAIDEAVADLTVNFDELGQTGEDVIDHFNRVGETADQAAERWQTTLENWYKLIDEGTTDTLPGIQQALEEAFDAGLIDQQGFELAMDAVLAKMAEFQSDSEFGSAALAEFQDALLDDMGFRAFVKGAGDAQNASQRLVAGLLALTDGQEYLKRLSGQNVAEWERYASTLDATAKTVDDPLRKELQKLAADIRRVGSESEAFETLKTRVQSVAGVLKDIGGKFSTLLGANLGGLGGLLSTGFGIFEQVKKGDFFGAVVAGIGSVIDALSGFQRAAEEARKANEDFLKQFTLIDGSAFGGAYTRSRGFFADLFGGGPEVVRWANELAVTIAKALEGGVKSGLGSGIKNFMDGSGNILDGLKEGIRGAIINAITEAVIQGAIVKGALGGLLTQLTGALASGNNGVAASIVGQIQGVLPGLATTLETTLAPLKGALGGLSSPSLSVPESTVGSLPVGMSSAVSTAQMEQIALFGQHVASFGRALQRGMTITIQQDGTDYTSRLALS